SGHCLRTSARSTHGSFATAACASSSRTAKKPLRAYGSTASRSFCSSTRSSVPTTRSVRSGQRSAPIQPCSTATTGSATSASASSHATRRRKALTGRLLRRRRDSGFGIRDSQKRKPQACACLAESRIPNPESRPSYRRLQDPPAQVLEGHAENARRLGHQRVAGHARRGVRSEEHTSELQSRENLV